MFLESCFQREDGYDGKKTIPPSLQDIKDTMETGYACKFPETFIMMNIFLVSQIGTACEMII